MHYVSLIVEFLTRAAARGVLGRGVVAGHAVDACAGAVLQRAARQRADAARHRPRIRPRQLSRAAARLLAGGARLPYRRRFRLLRGVAGLHRGHLLGGVRARTFDRRHAPRRAGGAADGGRCRFHRAEPGVRRVDHGGAVVGVGAAALLAGGGRGQARLLVPAGARSRSVAAGELCRPHPDRADARVHAGDRARAPFADEAGAVVRGAASGHRRISACRLAVGQPRAGGRGPKREPGAGGRPCALALAPPRIVVGASGIGVVDRIGERLAAAAARAPARDRPQPDRVGWRAGTSTYLPWRRPSSPSPLWR